MYYNIIKFPFSSVNDTNYVLAVCLNSTGDFTATNARLAQQPRLFTRQPTQLVAGETVYKWEGTLTGSVKASDDEREDMWVPLVCSKLQFNMAVNDFPDWLMDYCDNYRARVIVYKDESKPIEMWRGYMVGQTLNMTVVNDLLSVSLVAVDEVAMAKYMNFKLTTAYVTNNHWCTMFGLMEHFHTLHHTRGLSASAPGFEKLYQILDLSTTNRMMWHLDLSMIDSNGDPINDIPSTAVVNLDRWLQDKEATWADCLSAVCEYWGVTFAVGSYGLMIVHDAYLLTCPTASPTVQQFVYTFDLHTINSHSNSMYATFINPPKVGANFQITTAPDKYKEVVVKSKPERWEGHDYLTDEHYKEIDPVKEVRFEWGQKESGRNFEKMEWHKLKYTKPDAEEAEFVEIAPCANGEGYLMARDGVLPCVDINSCDNLTAPKPSCADTIDFITFKEGCCCIKLGQGETGGFDEDKELSNFFLLMNHMWGVMPGLATHTMATEHLADTPWLTLYPFGDVAAVQPADKHFLSIKFGIKFVRENWPSNPPFGSFTPNYLFLKAVNASTPAVNVYWNTTPAMIMPSETSEYDYSETSIVNASLSLWYDLYFKAYIRIGSHYYDGTGWVYVAPGDTPPKCDVTLWSDSNKLQWVTDTGERVVATKNYYYTIATPYRGSSLVDRYTNNTRLLSNLYGVSVHGQPLHGRLEIQILGQIRFQGGQTDTQRNSLPFALINDIEIGYTDDAEFVEDDIEWEGKVTMDAQSGTKETLERSIKLASPKVDGFFSNSFVYDDGKAWVNLRQVRFQSPLPLQFPPEWAMAQRLSHQYSAGQTFVDFATPFNFDDNVFNVCFTIQDLTEIEGKFLPVKRDFDYTLERLRVKLIRVNTRPID